MKVCIISALLPNEQGNVESDVKPRRSISFQRSLSMNSHRKTSFIYPDADKESKIIAKAMEDDFNTPVAMATLNQGFRQVNDLMRKKKNQANVLQIAKNIKSLEKVGQVLGLFRKDAPSQIKVLKAFVAGNALF